MEVTPEIKKLAQGIAQAHPLSRRKFTPEQVKAAKPMRVLGAASRFAENDPEFDPKPEAA